MAEIDTKTLVERAGQGGASFDRSAVSKWRAGDNTADPTNAVIIARVLNRDPAEALRAAGHEALAADWARRIADTPTPGAAQAWRAWLLDTAGGEEAVLRLSARSKGAIAEATARAWAAGAESATPIAAILTARLLGAAESSALAAAGHSHYAAVFAALNPHTPALNGEH